MTEDLHLVVSDPGTGLRLSAQLGHIGGFRQVFRHGSRASVLKAVSADRGTGLWVLAGSESLNWLLAALGASPRRLGRVLLLDGPEPAALAPLGQSFKQVVPRPAFLLPRDQLLGVLAHPQRADLCLGGTVLLEAGLLYLLRGDLSGLLVPLADFAPGPGSPKPNFKRFSVTDHGQTLVLGRFEAAFEAVLYEHDRRFRRRLRARMSAADRSLGASLRRLRKQKGLRLQDFGPLEKSLARIERGQVTRPRRSTLDPIAQRLGCSVEELGSY
jgi:hypothetical protein